VVSAFEVLEHARRAGGNRRFMLADAGFLESMIRAAATGEPWR